MCGSGFRPPETKVVRGSLVEAALEGGGANGSSIWQSGTDVGEAWAMGAFPRSGVVSRSGVLRQMGILTPLLEKCSSCARENQQKFCWFPMRIRNT